MPAPAPERRQSSRVATTGRVEILFGDPVPVCIDAELVEASAVGFRAAHDSKDLEPGREVFFRRSGELPAKARVIWTHVLGDKRVSGFLLLH
jgi:hypothetical protein